MPSLRATIGAMTAITVLAVAATTLSVTLTYSIDALRTIGKTHAATQLQLSAAQAASLLHAPVRMTQALQTEVALKGHGLPRSNATAQLYSALVLASLLSHSTALNSAIAVFRDGGSATARYLSPDVVRESRTIIAAPGVARSDGVTFYAVNRSRVPASIAAAADAPSDLGYLFRPNGLLQPALDTLSGSLARAALWISADDSIAATGPAGSRPQYALRCLRALRNTGNDSDAPIGIASASVELSALSGFLASTRSTSRSHAFMLDADGFLLGTTWPQPFTAARPVPLGHTPTAGCGTTERTMNGSASNMEVCRTHASAHAFLPLRAVHTETRMLLPRGAPAVEHRKLAGANFFVAREVIYPPNSIGLSVVMVLFLPEEDVLRGVATGRNIAIGVSVAVFVVATVVAVAVVAVMLNPLTTISAEMQRVADLEDDTPTTIGAENAASGSAAPRSAMSEVAALQDSFAALASQLTRVRSYVPQSVLAGVYAPADADDDEDADALGGPSEGHSFSLTDDVSYSGTPRSAEHSDSVSNASNAAVIMSDRLNTRVGLLERPVTIVVANLKGFHHRATSQNAVRLPRLYANYIDVVITAAERNGGVLDSFHGDRVMLTFNAARRLHKHTLRAVSAALAVASAPLRIQLPVVVGVATGNALAGNMGNPRAKRFCTIGSVVLRAHALLSLAPLYDADPPSVSGAARLGCRVLAAARVLDDVAAAYVTRPLDFVQLQRDTSVGGSVVAEIVRPRHDAKQHAAAADQHHWLYAAPAASAPSVPVDMSNSSLTSPPGPPPLFAPEPAVAAVANNTTTSPTQSESADPSFSASWTSCPVGPDRVAAVYECLRKHDPTGARAALQGCELTDFMDVPLPLLRAREALDRYDELKVDNSDVVVRVPGRDVKLPLCGAA